MAPEKQLIDANAKMIDKCIGEQMDKLMDTFSGKSDYQLDLSTYSYSNFLPIRENQMIWCDY